MTSLADAHFFSNYLTEKGLPDIDDIATLDLPSILEDFYLCVCMKEKDGDPYEDSKRWTGCNSSSAQPFWCSNFTQKKEKSIQQHINESNVQGTV